MRLYISRILFFFLFYNLFFVTTTFSQNLSISGTIKDKKDNSPLPGATVRVQNQSNIAASTDIDGNFTLKGLKRGVCNLEVSFISFKTQIVKNVNAGNKDVVVSMESESADIDGVTITAQRKTNTDMALISTIKKAEVVVSGISAQQISRSQDKDASEVVRRIPGVTIVGNRFILVRGLNERYNSVQLNDATAPSMESDVRSFSFDIIPSSLIDRILINKSPSPDLPGDFAGGAVKIYTKSIPDKNFIEIGYSAGYKIGSAFKDFYDQPHGNLQWLGFNDGKYNFPKNFPADVRTIGENEVEIAGKSLPNAWIPFKSNSGMNQGASLTGAFRFKINNMNIGHITSINYGTNKTIYNIVRRDYTNYDAVNNKSVYLYDYSDKQYTHNVKLGVLHNWALQINPSHIITLRNLYNQYGQSQYILRMGTNHESDQNVETHGFYNLYRGIYTGQLNGIHKPIKDKLDLDWVLSYGYSYRQEPDFRRYRYNIETATHKKRIYFPGSTDPFSLGRLFSDMKEHIYGGNANAVYKFKFGKNSNFDATLKAGIGNEYKDRWFNARNLGYVKTYKSDSPLLDSLDINTLFGTKVNNTDGIRLGEETNDKDSYKANNNLIDGYLSLNTHITPNLTVIGGVRVENNTQKLNNIYNENIVNKNKLSILPSINLSYNFTEKSLLRAAYGTTVNRPEFREIAPFSFYDFNFNIVKIGNPKLQDATIHNFDLRYEYYPTPSEIVSAGVFYKYFVTPIENVVLLGSGGNAKNFTCDNAKNASSYGIEVEAKKTFYGLTHSSFLDKMSIVFNASFIKSVIELGKKAVGQSNKRPLQGQSPFIVNAGLQYKDDPWALQINVMYNVIGKRIYAIGYEEYPDIYEMPRHLLDLTITKGLGKYFEVKLGVNDILNNQNILLQDGNQDGKFDAKKDQIIQKFSPGSVYTLGISYKPF